MIGALGLLLAGCGDTSGPVLVTASLLQWCGGELCDWNVESGEVHRVTTWHEGEYGASLDGETVVLSTLWLAPPDTACIVASLTHRRLGPAGLEVAFEAGDRASIWQIPPADYEIRHRVVELGGADELELRITKQGAGEVVLAWFALSDPTPECPPSPP